MKINALLQSVHLRFVSFSLEGQATSPTCYYDYLALYDGPDENADYIGKYCSQSTPPDRQTSGNMLYLKFYSDHR